MFKIKGYDTTNPNFVSDEVKSWGLQGNEEGRPFNALWIDRSDDHSMFMSFTKTFMESETEGTPSLFDQYKAQNKSEIDLDFTFVFKNIPDDKKGNPPILNLAENSCPIVDILAFRVITKDNEMITNINTGLGVNNYVAWVSPEKQELIMVSSFDDINSYIELFVQNTETNMVTKYLIGFNTCYAAIPFPSSKKFKVPDKIKVPITRHDLNKVSETLVVVIEGDELSTPEKKMIGEKNATLVSVLDNVEPEIIQKEIETLAKENRNKKVILVRTTPIVTGIILKMFHNNVFVMHQYEQTGKLFKIV
jgi:hypothetical protein